jgi:hypothetical protein
MINNLAYYKGRALQKYKCLLLRHALLSLSLSLSLSGTSCSQDNTKDNITLELNRYLAFSEVTSIIYCKSAAKIRRRFILCAV